jgi:hypothetical protein
VPDVALDAGPQAASTVARPAAAQHAPRARLPRVRRIAASPDRM